MTYQVRHEHFGTVFQRHVRVGNRRVESDQRVVGREFQRVARLRGYDEPVPGVVLHHFKRPFRQTIGREQCEGLSYVHDGNLSSRQRGGECGAVTTRADGVYRAREETILANEE